MTQKTQPEDFTPGATVEDIQPRLLRSPSLHSSQNLGSCGSRRLEVSLAELQKNEERESTKRKLVDYLDPVLLGAISATISRSKKEATMKTKIMRTARAFEWPVDKLKVFVEVSGESRADQRSDGAVDLNNESEPSCRGGDGGERSTPFEWFDQTALKRFTR